jgi:hypothetical protein
MGDSDLVRHRIRAGSRRQIRRSAMCESQDFGRNPAAAERRVAADQIT